MDELIELIVRGLIELFSSRRSACAAAEDCSEVSAPAAVARRAPPGATESASGADAAAAVDPPANDARRSAAEDAVRPARDAEIGRRASAAAPNARRPAADFRSRHQPAHLLPPCRSADGVRFVRDHSTAAGFARRFRLAPGNHGRMAGLRKFPREPHDPEISPSLFRGRCDFHCRAVVLGICASVRTSFFCAGKPDIQVVLRPLEAKLTEIDLLNKGNAPGSLDLAVDVSWQDADLDRTQGLAGFDEIDTGRMGVRFHPRKWPSASELSPGENRAIGWVQLTDQSPLHAEIVTGPAATQP